MVSKLCYYFFRTAHLLNKSISEENIAKAIFLCETAPSPILEFLSPGLNGQIQLSPQEKLEHLDLRSENLFPFTRNLSEKINAAEFALSFLQQPNLYLRIRPEREKHVIAALKQNQIDFSLNKECVQLNNAVNLEKVQGLNKNFVVQDQQSQRVFDKLSHINLSAVKMAWDCCAASGGKSILLFDKISHQIILHISDIRKTILDSAKQRLAAAGIPVYRSEVCDLTKTKSAADIERFDLIICDVPCTGSGTWSRTPDQLYFFKEKMIDDYSQRQRLIASNAIKHLDKNGFFIYITCSVFQQENEAVLDFLISEEYTLIAQDYYLGYHSKADNLFVAILQKSN